MKHESSSKLALRALVGESRDKRLIKEKQQEARPKMLTPQIIQAPVRPVNEDQRKRQLQIGKIVLDYIESEPLYEESVPRPAKKVGRPQKIKSEKARNITLCLSKDHIEFLDKVELPNSKAQGRGTRAKFIFDEFLKYRKRELNQVRVLKDALIEVAKHLKEFSQSFKRVENFEKNKDSIEHLERAISNVRILNNLLKIDLGDLKVLLKHEEYSSYVFCLNWISNRSTSEEEQDI